MATLTPQQQQAISQTLSQMQNTLSKISQALPTLTPQQVQQVAPSLSAALSQGSNVVSRAGQVVSSPQNQVSAVLTGGGGNIQSPQTPLQNTQPPLSPPASPQTPDWQTAYNNLLNQFQLLTSKYANPPTPDTSNISNIYSQTAEDLKAKYQKVLADLQKKQQEDQQRLIGRYAAAGFSEPGILGGSPAGIPGVATKGLNELESQQASDITNLQQAQAGDLNALAAAQASAEQQAQQQAIDNYYRQLQLIQSALGNQATLISGLEPQTYQIGGRVYQNNPMTGTFTDVTPPEIQAQLQKEEQQKGMSAPFTDDQGNVWVYDANQQKLIKVGKVAPKQSSLQVITDKITGEPLYIFDKTTGDLIPLTGSGSSPFSSSSQQTAPGAPQSGFLQNLWSKIKSWL